MITSTTKLEELIHIERQAIPPDFCDSIVNNIENNYWSTHEWTTSEFDTFSHKDKELDISFPQNDDSDTDNEETDMRRRHGRVTYTDHKIDRKLDRERRNRENEFRKLANKLNTEI